MTSLDSSDPMQELASLTDRLVDALLRAQRLLSVCEFDQLPDMEDLEFIDETVKLLG